MLKPNLPLNPTFKNGPHAKSCLFRHSNGLVQEVHEILIPNGTRGPLQQFQWQALA